MLEAVIGLSYATGLHYAFREGLWLFLVMGEFHIVLKFEFLYDSFMFRILFDSYTITQFFLGIIFRFSDWW